MKARNIILAAVALVAVGLGVWYFVAKPAPKKAAAPVRTTEIKIKHASFEPATAIIKKGTKVTWTSNEDDLEHIIASNPYPSHTDLPGLLSKEISEGDSYSYTFDKVGTFGYHDHLNPTINGTIIVQ